MYKQLHGTTIRWCLFKQAQACKACFKNILFRNNLHGHFRGKNVNEGFIISWAYVTFSNSFTNVSSVFNVDDRQSFSVVAMFTGSNPRSQRLDCLKHDGRMCPQSIKTPITIVCYVLRYALECKYLSNVYLESIKCKQTSSTFVYRRTNVGLREFFLIMMCSGEL